MRQPVMHIRPVAKPSTAVGFGYMWHTNIRAAGIISMNDQFFDLYAYIRVIKIVYDVSYHYAA